MAATLEFVRHLDVIVIIITPLSIRPSLSMRISLYTSIGTSYFNILYIDTTLQTYVDDDRLIYITRCSYIYIYIYTTCLCIYLNTYVYDTINVCIHIYVYLLVLPHAICTIYCVCSARLLVSSRYNNYILVL